MGVVLLYNSRGTTLTIVRLTGAAQESFSDCAALRTWQPRVDGQDVGPGAPITRRPLFSPDVPTVRVGCSTVSQILLPLLLRIFFSFKGNLF